MQAAAPTPPPTADLPAGPSPLLDLAVTLLAFLAVILLAWLAARWLLRRMYGPGAGGGRIRVLERLPLEPRRTLYLVEAGEKLLLVGSTEHEIRLLGEFSREELPAPLPPAERRTFLDALRSMRGR